MMHRQIVLTWAVAAIAISNFGSSAAAQGRGYGTGYDAGPNYLEPNPAYDPFLNEGATNPDQRYTPRSLAEEDRAYGMGPRPLSRRGIRVRKAQVAIMKRVKPSKPSLWLSDKP